MAEIRRQDAPLGAPAIAGIHAELRADASHPRVAELSSFFYDYPIPEEHSKTVISLLPDIDDKIPLPTMNQLLATHTEIYELQSSLMDQPPSRGQKTKTQARLVRLLNRPITRLLMMSAPGSGKSCGVAIPAESMFAGQKLAEIDYVAQFYTASPTNIRRGVILTKGGNLVEEFKRQIACNCNVTGTYDQMNITDKSNQSSAKKRRDKNIHVNYDVETYHTFFKRLRGMSNREMIEYCTGLLVAIDEIQAFIPKVLKVSPDRRAKRAANIQKRILEGQAGADKLDQEDMYREAYRMSHLCPNMIFIGMTGTLMGNAVFELAREINLFVPLENQVPMGWSEDDYIQTLHTYEDDGIGTRAFYRVVYDPEKTPQATRVMPIIRDIVNTRWKEKDWDNITADQLRPHIDGYIAFIENGVADVVIKYEGGIIDSGSQRRLVGLEMNEIDGVGQLALYRAVEHDKKNLYTSQRWASDFVYPPLDGVYFQGKDALKYYFFGKEPHLEPTDYLRNELKTNPRLWSIKFAFISEDAASKRQGKSYVYDEFDTANGAKLLETMLLAQVLWDHHPDGTRTPRIGPDGREMKVWQKYNPGDVKYTARGPDRAGPGPMTRTKGGEVQGICPTYTAAGEILIDPSDPEKGIPHRFAVYRVGSEREQRIILRDFNREENRLGQYIRLIIVTKQGQIGISLKGTVWIYVVGATFNESTLYQSIYRGIRADGFVQLTNEIQQRRIDDPGLMTMKIEEAILENDPQMKANDWWTLVDGVPVITDSSHSVADVEAMLQNDSALLRKKMREAELMSNQKMIDNNWWTVVDENTSNPRPKVVVRIHLLAAMKPETINAIKGVLPSITGEYGEGMQDINLDVDLETRGVSAAVNNGLVNIIEGIDRLHSNLTIDMKFYMLAESKDKKIKRMERILASLAIDCAETRALNMPWYKGRPLTGPVPNHPYNYTPICAYDQCWYPCYDAMGGMGPVADTDDSAMVLYQGNALERMSAFLKSVLGEKGYISFSRLKGEATEGDSNIHPRLLDTTIEKVIYQRLELIDRFGRQAFAFITPDGIGLTNEFPSKAVSENDGDAYYTSHLVSTQMTDQTPFPRPIDIREKTNTVIHVASNPAAVEMDLPDPGLVFDYIDGIFLATASNIFVRIDVLEASLIRYLTNGMDERMAKMVNYFGERVCLYKLREPLHALAIEAEAASARGSGRGAKAKDEEREITRQADAELEEALNPLDEKTKQRRAPSWGEEIWIHCLMSRVPRSTLYSFVDDTMKVRGNIRILKPSEQIMNNGVMVWRDANKAEQHLYNRVFQALINGRINSIGANERAIRYKRSYIVQIQGKDDIFIISKAIEKRSKVGANLNNMDPADVMAVLWDIRSQGNLPIYYGGNEVPITQYPRDEEKLKLWIKTYPLGKKEKYKSVNEWKYDLLNFYYNIIIEFVGGGARAGGGRDETVRTILQNTLYMNGKVLLL